MRVSHGKYGERFVYDVRVGDRKVKRIMYGGKQIWPTYGERIRTMTLDVAEVEGTLPWVYLKHALAAVQGGSGAGCYVCVYADGSKRWNLESTYEHYKLANWTEGIIDFAGEGPHRQAVRVGDRGRLQMVVPEVEGAVYAAEAGGEVVWTDELGWLPGTKLSMVWSKGQKKVSADVEFSVTGDGSGVVHIGGRGSIQGHGRGEYDADVEARRMGVHSGEVTKWQDGYEPGDSGVRVWVKCHNDGTTVGHAHLVFPAFVREVELKVTGLTYDE